MLLFSVCWHLNFFVHSSSCILLSFTSRGFYSASSQMSGGDAPLKVCQGNLLLKVCWKIPGTAVGEEALSHSYCFSWLTKISFGALMNSEKSCQDLEMARKATKIMVFPLLKYAPGVRRIWRQLLVCWPGVARGQPRAQVIGQIHGYRYGPRENHFSCVILQPTEMSDALLNRALPFPLQHGLAWAFTISSETCLPREGCSEVLPYI